MSKEMDDLTPEQQKTVKRMLSKFRTKGWGYHGIIVNGKANNWDEDVMKARFRAAGPNPMPACAQEEREAPIEVVAVGPEGPADEMFNLRRGSPIARLFGNRPTATRLEIEMRGFGVDALIKNDWIFGVTAHVKQQRARQAAIAAASAAHA